MKYENPILGVKIIPLKFAEEFEKKTEKHSLNHIIEVDGIRQNVLSYLKLKRKPQKLQTG